MAAKRSAFRNKILVPIVSSFGGLFFLFLLTVYRVEYSNLSEEVERHLDEVEALLAEKITSETALLGSSIELLAENKELQSAFRDRDRELLYQLSRPFLSMQREYGITHFYYHDADRTNFLRVYDPDRFGDRIERSIVRGAAATGRPSAGIEIGALGTLSLRAAHPWLYDGKIQGFIELGFDLEYIIRSIREIIGVEIYVSVYKEFLERERWEAGQRLMGGDAEWELLPEAVVVNQTLERIPPELSDFLRPGEHGYMEMSPGLELDMNEHVYRVGVLPLFDAGSREIGDIVILYDVKRQQAAFARSVLLAAGGSALLALVLTLFFSSYLGSLEVKIDSYQDGLETMVAERTKELSEAMAEIKTLRGIIPICSFCKKIRDDEGAWNQVEEYVHEHTEASFSHGVCPECVHRHYPLPEGGDSPVEET